MKPDDSNGDKPLDERPFRVLILSGSNRRQYNCPGVDSKSRTLMFRMGDRLPQEWEIDLEDLGNVYARNRIQSCNACVSTSQALCCWPCNCYEKGSKAEPDLMWDLDLYARLDLADAWAIIGPHNWYGPTSNLKLMFDRLVCMNGGNPLPKQIGWKDAEKAMAFEQTDEFERASQNHLEGRTCAFFAYGDKGGDEIGEDGRPSLIRLEHKHYFNPDEEPFNEAAREAYLPLVWQCRYSGIEVPDELWDGGFSGVGKPYRLDQAEHVVQDDEFMGAFDGWTDRFAAFVAQKGKVPPGEYRAHGYEHPGHMFDEIKLLVRQARLHVGLPRAGSSPAKQQELGVNQDSPNFSARKGEGEKLRD